MDSLLIRAPRGVDCTHAINLPRGPVFERIKVPPYDLSRYRTQPRVEVDQHAAKRIGRLITAAGRQARPSLDVYTRRLCVCLSSASCQGYVLPHRSSLVHFGRAVHKIYSLFSSLPLASEFVDLPRPFRSRIPG
jgi:hypothetical protein